MRVESREERDAALRISSIWVVLQRFDANEPSARGVALVGIVHPQFLGEEQVETSALVDGEVVEPAVREVVHLVREIEELVEPTLGEDGDTTGLLGHEEATVRRVRECGWRLESRDDGPDLVAIGRPCERCRGTHEEAGREEEPRGCALHGCRYTADAVT